MLSPQSFHLAIKSLRRKGAYSAAISEADQWIRKRNLLGTILVRGSVKSLHAGGRNHQLLHSWPDPSQHSAQTLNSDYFMGTICILSVFFYSIHRSQNAPKLLYCFVAASLEIAGSGVTSQRQIISESQTSVLSGLSVLFTSMFWKHIRSYQDMLFPYKSSFGYSKVISFFSYNKINKTQPNYDTTSAHPKFPPLIVFFSLIATAMVS